MKRGGHIVCQTRGRTWGGMHQRPPVPGPRCLIPILGSGNSTTFWGFGRIKLTNRRTILSLSKRAGNSRGGSSFLVQNILYYQFVNSLPYPNRGGQQLG